MRHAVEALLLTTLLTLPLTAPAQPVGERVQFGSDIVIEEGEAATEAVCIGCSITMRGSLTGDAVAIGGNIEVHSPVGGETVAVGGNITLGANATVGGDVVSVGGRIDRDPEASVGGEITTAPGLPIAGAGLAGLLLVGLALCSVINLVLVLLCYLLAGEQRVDTMAATLRERAGLAFLTGLGVAVGVILLFIFAATLGPLTPIVVIVVALAFLLTLLVGYTGLSSWLGRSLARKSSPLLAVLLGAVLVTILQLIPLVGLLLFLVFFLLSLGIATLSGYGTAPNWLPQRFGH